MGKMFLLILTFFALLMTGCCHSRTVAAVKVDPVVDFIETKHRYRVVFSSKGEDRYKNLEGYCPDVFSNDGIPVTLRQIDGKADKFGNWTLIFLTSGILASFETAHSHGVYEIGFSGENAPKATVEYCVHGGCSLAMFSPLPLLFFNWGGNPCFDGGSTFVSNSYELQKYDALDFNTEAKAIAHGIAVRLKELEDAGRIDEYVVANARSAQALKDMAAGQAKAKLITLRREGVLESAIDETKMIKEHSSVDVVRCDCEAGRDFAYRFVLARKGGKMITPFDYNAIRTSFRNAIRSHYVSGHAGVNPRSLVVDFPEWSLNGGQITGRAVVLMVTAESVSYNSSLRTGVIAVRIGANQLAEVRNWIRKNIGELATKSNIAVNGDALPSGARFYTGREIIKESNLLEVEFRTE